MKRFFVFNRVLAIFTMMFSLWGVTNYTYAECHAPQTDVDVAPEKVYLRDGYLSLADIYSPADLTAMVAILQTVTCDKTPVYVAIQGSPTAFFKVADAVFKYNDISEAYGIGALLNKVQVSILGKGQAPGAKVFDIYVHDSEMKVGEGWKGLHIISARAETVDTDWTAANCALDVPSIINLPDSSPGKQVSASFSVKIACDKQPNSYLAYQIYPESEGYDMINGVLYDKKNIKISLLKDDLPVDISHLMQPSLGSDYTSIDNYKIVSDIGKSASSGEYSADFIIYLYHN
ncbi:hypothetical protein NTH58_004028 [Enterobacter oligotrophicus]|nr:hypothetical protein [Enterobacter oligotrophicus]